MKVKEKICINCKKPFKPSRTTQRVCSPKCAIDVAKAKTKKQEDKEWRKHKKERLEKIQPRSHFEKKLEEAINAIVRAIDFGNRCISCDEARRAYAGHYHSVKAHPAIRYNLHNIHVQDYECNVKKSGNIQGYDLGLIEAYGRRYWEYIKFVIVREKPLLKLTIEELKEKAALARSIYRKLYKDQKKRSEKERMKLRYEINEELGIY